MELNPKKAIGQDKIATKIVLSANIIDSHLVNINNEDITKSFFSEGAKISSPKPIFKKKGYEKIENYKPFSILNCSS